MPVQPRHPCLGPIVQLVLTITLQSLYLEKHTPQLLLMNLLDRKDTRDTDRESPSLTHLGLQGVALTDLPRRRGRRIWTGCDDVSTNALPWLTKSISASVSRRRDYSRKQAKQSKQSEQT